MDEMGMYGGDVSKEMFEAYSEKYESPHGDSG